MACRAYKVQVCPKRTQDPLDREGTGSVVGIHLEVAGMYTGTLIGDLMTTVEQAELRAEQHRIANDQELHAIFEMQFPITEGDQVFMGAA
jgi:hypothetical protein